MATLHKVTAMAKPDKILKLDGISAESVEAHWAPLRGLLQQVQRDRGEAAVAPTSAAANQIYSDYRALRENLTFAIGGIKNHELYFDNLGPAAAPPTTRSAR